MPVNRAQFIPGNPVYQEIRPLNKGIQVHLPPQLAPVGSLQNAQNFQIIPNGLLRREAQQNYASSLSVEYPPIQDMYVFFDTTTGLQKTIVIDQKFIYEFNNTAMTGKYWVYDTGTITADVNPQDIFQAFTNLVQDPTDLTTANWPETNSDATISTLSINGNLFTKIANVGANEGNVTQNLTNTFTNLVLTGKAIVKKGVSTNNSARLGIYNQTTASLIFGIILDFDNFSSLPGTVSDGTLLKYNWIDSETLEFFFQCDSLTDTGGGNSTDDVQIFVIGSNSVTPGDYNYWTEVQLIDEAEITMFPFVEGIHAIDIINETFTLPDQCTIVWRGKPRFAFDTASNKYFWSWRIDATHYLYLDYLASVDAIIGGWRDGGGSTITLASYQFDDGSSFTDINQEMTLVFSFDGSSGSQTGSRLIIIPSESGVVNEDATFSGTPDVKSSTFPTMAQGHFNSLNQADSEVSYARIYDDLLVGAVTSSADLANLLGSMTNLLDIDYTSSTAVVGNGTTWTGEELQNGDVIVLDLDGSENGPESVEVDSITNNTNLVLKTSPLKNHPAGTDYEIRRAFKTAEGRYVDAVVDADNELVIVDGSRTPYVYDGTDLTKADAGNVEIPSCVAYFRDRLFYGKILSGGTDYRYRIMWTEPGIFGEIPNTNFIDLPYQPGEVVDLVPMGNTLVAFFDDAVYIGINSQMPNLPVYFQRIDTGNVGLVGMKAFVDFFDSLFFVGQDDIYQLSTQGIQPIGTPIVKRSLRETQKKKNIYAVVDTERSKVIFGFPKDGTSMEELWTYDYRTKAWGMEKITCDSLSDVAIFTGYTVGGLDAISGTIDGLDAFFPTIDSMTYSNVAPYNIYLGVSASVHFFLKQTTDEGSTRITSIIETQDYDLGKPQSNKTFSELSLKLESAITTDLSFTVEGTKDRGTNWASLGTLTILNTETEGKVNFKLTGGLGRFKLTSATDNEQYIVNEILLKVKLRGQEARFDG